MNIRKESPETGIPGPQSKINQPPNYKPSLFYCNHKLGFCEFAYYRFHNQVYGKLAWPVNKINALLGGE